MHHGLRVDGFRVSDLDPRPGSRSYPGHRLLRRLPRGRIWRSCAGGRELRHLERWAGRPAVDPETRAGAVVVLDRDGEWPAGLDVIGLEIEVGRRGARC